LMTVLSLPVKSSAKPELNKLRVIISNKNFIKMSWFVAVNLV